MKTQSKRPSPKPTRAEMEDRVAYAVHLLARCAYKGEIKRLLRARFGEMSSWTVERLLQRAREVLARRAGAAWGEHRTDSLAFYESVIRDPATSLRDKLFAQKRIDTLFGLTARPVADRGESSGEQGGPRSTPQVALPEEAVRALVAFLSRPVADLPPAGVEPGQAGEEGLHTGPLDVVAKAIAPENRAGQAKVGGGRRFRPPDPFRTCRLRKELLEVR